MSEILEEEFEVRSPVLTYENTDIHELQVLESIYPTELTSPS